MAPRPSHSRRRSNPSPERRSGHNAAFLATGIVVGAAAIASLAQRNKSKAGQTTEWRPSKDKRLTWEEDYYHDEDNSDRKSSSSTHTGKHVLSMRHESRRNDIDTDSIQPVYEQRYEPSSYHEYEANDAAAVPLDYWTWNNKKQMYCHDSEDGQLRVFEDGTREALRPPPRPEPPELVWDKSRKMWYSHNEVGKCWLYTDGSSIPFPE